MTHYYSPHTGEHINTNNPADWMSSTALPVPSYDPTTSSAIFTNGAWSVVQAMPVLAPDTEALRKAAYREESDPLFFKWQRGEATEAEWIASVNAIKTRYPEPT